MANTATSCGRPDGRYLPASASAHFDVCVASGWPNRNIASVQKPFRLYCGAEFAMAASIVHLLGRLAEVEAERDFYKAAASRLNQPCKGRRKQ